MLRDLIRCKLVFLTLKTYFSKLIHTEKVEKVTEAAVNLLDVNFSSSKLRSILSP